MRNGGEVADPVLERLSNITAMDAVLKHDTARMRDDGTLDEYPNPRRPDWPQADYIVGNPPFIGGKDVRARLGDGYATALWKAHPKINKSADFVMYWWDRAAERLTEKGTRLKRFGFVTTNSITQEFSRRVMAARMDARAPISLVMAIPDHPWTKATKDAAAVRIAMTVAEAGTFEGVLHEIGFESGLDSDTPNVELSITLGEIYADLTVGANLSKVKALRANEWLSSRGVSLHGAGFIISPAESAMLGLGHRDGLERHIRPYRNGRDLMARSRQQLIIDLFGLNEVEVRQSYPEIYQRLLTTVKIDRDRQAIKSPTADALAYAQKWWIFGKPRTGLRPALENLTRYVVTVETAKHRVFQFLDADILPDNMLMCVAIEEPYFLGLLSSRVHLEWTYVNCGLLGVASFEQGHRYTKTNIFDPFPFPNATPEQRTIIGDLAEELDATRKDVLAEHTDLTLTGLYNLRDKLRRNTPFTDVEQDQRRRGRVDIIAELHDRIDDAVADAYGWPRDLTDEQIVTRLVALNAERQPRNRRARSAGCALIIRSPARASPCCRPPPSQRRSRLCSRRPRRRRPHSRANRSARPPPSSPTCAAQPRSPAPISHAATARV